MDGDCGDLAEFVKKLNTVYDFLPPYTNKFVGAENTICPENSILKSDRKRPPAVSTWETFWKVNKLEMIQFSVSLEVQNVRFNLKNALSSRNYNEKQVEKQKKPGREQQNG